MSRFMSETSSPLVKNSTGSFQPHVISAAAPQPRRVQYNKSEGNTEAFAKDPIWAAATWSSKWTGCSTVPTLSLPLGKPQAQAGEGSCTARRCPRAAHSRGLLPRMSQALGHAAGASHKVPEGQYVIHCTWYSLLFILYSESQHKEKSNPKNLGATYGRHFYWNSSKKKISKTPPDKFQARFKKRNAETKAVEATSIYIFQCSCIQFPAKGFSCDEQGCKIQKRDTVFLWFFSGSRLWTPCPSLSSGHSSFTGDGKPLSQRVVQLSQTLMLNCHKSIPTWMLRLLLLPRPPFHPFSLHMDRSPGSSHVTKSTFGHSTRGGSTRGCWLRPAPRADDMRDDQPKKNMSPLCLCACAHVCTHTCLLFYFFVQLELIRNDKHCLSPESSSGGMKYAS